MTAFTVAKPLDYTLTERDVKAPGTDRLVYGLIEAHHRDGARIACACTYSDAWLVCTDAGIDDDFHGAPPVLAATKDAAREWVVLLAALYSAAVGRTVNSELIVAPKPVPDAQVAIQKCGRGWQSTCGCGTDGRPRISRARARQDARDHSARTGHENLAVAR